MNKICILILLSIICVGKGYAQVYKRSDGKAETTVASSYKKLTIPAEYAAFYDKIKKIDSVAKNSCYYKDAAYIMFYLKGFAFLYLPSYEYSNSTAWKISPKDITNESNITFHPHFSTDMLATNGNVKSTGDLIKNTPYNDAQSNFVNKHNETFLENINASITTVSIFNADMQMPYFLYTNFPVECIWNRKFRNAGNSYAGNRLSDMIAMMDKQAMKKNDLIALKDLALIYAGGLDLTSTDPLSQGINFGKINIDNEKSLQYIEAMGKLSGTAEYSDVYDFTYKMVKAYDLLQIGAQQKDAAKAKQAADLYASLWGIASNDAQWNTLFDHIYQHVSSYSNKEDVKSAQYTGGGKAGNEYVFLFADAKNERKIDPYFVQAIKVQLLALLLKSCYQVQVLSPAVALTNNTLPADFAASAYKTFIDNFDIQRIPVE